jgi:hypothetical protein
MAQDDSVPTPVATIVIEDDGIVAVPPGTIILEQTPLWKDAALASLSVLGLVLLATLLRVLQQQAAQGSQLAQIGLSFFDYARDMLPVDKLSDYLEAQRQYAATTPSPIDDFVWGIPGAVWATLPPELREKVTEANQQVAAQITKSGQEAIPRG